jgi:zinc transport system ATP-binding protein
LSFDVSRGDNLVIVGENGSGKSTLMRALMGN